MRVTGVGAMQMDMYFNQRQKSKQQKKKEVQSFAAMLSEKIKEVRK